MTFNKTKYNLLLIFTFLYPLLPSFSIISGDLILVAFLVIEIRLLKGDLNYRKEVISLFKSIRTHKFFLCLIIFNIFMYLSSIYAISPLTSFSYGGRITIYLFVLYIVYYSLKLTKSEIYKILDMFIYSNILIGLLSIYEFIKSGHFLTATTEIDRVTSFLENSNVLGMYSVIAIFISIYLLVINRKVPRKYLYLFSTLLILCSIVFSESRNALLGVVVGCIAMLFLYKRAYFKYSLLLPLILFIIPFSRSRILELFDSTQNLSRIKLWKTTLLMIEENPVLGIGYNNFRTAYPEYVLKNPQELMHYTSYKPYHPHNIFLKIQSELGVVGTILLLSSIVLGIYYLYLLYKKANCRRSLFTVCTIFAIFSSFIFMNLFDSFIDSPKVIITFMLVISMAIKLISTDSK